MLKAGVNLVLAGAIATCGCSHERHSVADAVSASQPAAASQPSASPKTVASQPGKPFVGFDRNDYPGDDTMGSMRKVFSFTGYWLTNPPGRTRIRGPASAVFSIRRVGDFWCWERQARRRDPEGEEEWNLTRRPGQKRCSECSRSSKARRFSGTHDPLPRPGGGRTIARRTGGVSAGVD